jgi:uncharacterized membrane protein YphA (DoxX/SURF4 family)
MNQNKIIEIICCLLAILFVYASVSKLLEYDLFQLQLNQSPFITRFSGIIAWLLPIIEIIVGLLFMFRKWRLLAFYSSLFLLTLFTAYLVAMLNFSYYIPCSCGGVLSILSWKEHILFNLFFILLTITGLLFETNNLFTRD